MHTLDRPIVESSDAQGTAIAHPAAKHLPRIRQIVPILPNNRCHVAKMLWFGLAKAEGDEALELCFPVFLQFVRHQAESKFGFDPTGPEKAPTAKSLEKPEASADSQNYSDPPTMLADDNCHHEQQNACDSPKYASRSPYVLRKKAHEAFSVAIASTDSLA